MIAALMAQWVRMRDPRRSPYVVAYIFNNWEIVTAVSVQI